MKKFCIVMILFFAFFRISAYEDDEEKLKLAVMEIVDTNGTMQKNVLSDATEYLRVAMTSTGKFILIPKERQESAIKKLKRESWQECNDRNCRIPLGQALSADTMLTTKISRIGSTFIIVSQLIDLESESAAIAERKKYDGSDDSLLEALDYIAAQLTKKYTAVLEKEEKIRQEEIRREAEERRREAEERRKAEMRREAEEKRREEIRRENEKRRREAEIREAEKAREKEIEERRRQRQRRYAKAVDNERSGNLIKKTGYGMLIVGATSMGIGGLCFGLQEDIDGYEDYNNNMVATGISLLVIGGAVLLTGAILAPVGAVREKNARIELNSLSLAPTKGGMFASVGFNF